MNWAMERYQGGFVKLYTRDSMTWIMWPWQARALWPLILRRMDTRGLLAIDESKPVESVAVLTDMPIDVVRVGLAAIMESGTLVLVRKELLAPSFVEAQKSSKEKPRRMEMAP